MDLKESNNQAQVEIHYPLARAHGINIIQSSAEVTVKKLLIDLASGLLDRQQRFLRNSFFPVWNDKGLISMLLSVKA